MPPPAVPAHILCFGDGLTWGFRPGLEDAPYATTLRAELSRHTPVKVVVDAHATRPLAEYPARMRQAGASPPCPLTPVATAYDWIVVWGGQRDLADGAAVDDIAECLERTFAIAAESGAHVLALTVPEFAVPRHERQRRELNYRILAALPDGVTRFRTFDIARYLPNHSIRHLQGELKEHYTTVWGRLGPYPSKLGYAVIGREVAAQIRARGVRR